MGLAINLRFDLRRLDDEELSKRFEMAWNENDSIAASILPYTLRWSARGIIRHPVVYPFISFVAFSGPFYFSIGIALQLTVLSFLSLRRDFQPLIRMHLALCEARDITDEIQRRVRLRRKPAGSPT